MSAKPNDEGLEYRVPELGQQAAELQQTRKALQKSEMLCRDLVEKLNQAHDILEQRVKEKTADLARTNRLLQKKINERRRAEEALRKSEEKYRLLVENANDAIFVTQDGMIKYANSSAIAMTGYTAEELTRIPFANMIHPADRENIMERQVRRLKGEDVVANYTFRVLSKAGTELWQQINSVLITWEDRPATLSFIRDITHEKRLEKRLIQSQKMEAIGTLAGGIAHDFNNLMTTIQGNVSLMLFDFPSSHPNYQNLINIEKQIERGTRLISQLLGFAKKGKYQVRSIDINKLVTETSEAFGRTKKEIIIHRRLAADLWPIEVDQRQMEQALLNLYVNAAEAMPRGGRLDLQTMNVTQDAIKGKLYEPRKGRYVALSVSDNGEGMDQDIQQCIFDPFFTTKEAGSGSGLGLASVYGIVKGHGGYIEVDSAKGRGTTFYIFLPVVENKIAQPAETAGEITQGSGTILLVDDEKAVLKVGGRLLVKLGYEVIQADSGRQAVKLYEENQNNIDLVIADIVMPEMDGGEVFDRIRQIRADSKVLLASGYSIDGQAREILNRGCNGFIQKPFTLEQLSQKIRETLAPAENKAKT